MYTFHGNMFPSKLLQHIVLILIMILNVSTVDDKFFSSCASENAQL